MFMNSIRLIVDLKFFLKTILPYYTTDININLKGNFKKLTYLLAFVLVGGGGGGGGGTWDTFYISAMVLKCFKWILELIDTGTL